MSYLLLIPVSFAYLFVIVIFYNGILNNVAEESRYTYLTLDYKDKLAFILLAMIAPFAGIFVWDVWQTFKPLAPPLIRKNQWTEHKSFLGKYFKRKGQDLILWDGPILPEIDVDQFSHHIYKSVGPCNPQHAIESYGTYFAEEFFTYVHLHSHKMVMIGDRHDFSNCIGGMDIKEWIFKYIYPSKQSKCLRFLENNMPMGYLVVPHIVLAEMFRQYVWAKYRS